MLHSALSSLAVLLALSVPEQLLEPAPAGSVELATSVSSSADEAADLWRAARDRRKEDHDRLDALAELCTLELDEARKVAEYTLRECENRLRDLGKERGKLEEAFAEAAPEVMEERLGRDGESWMAEQRGVVLGNARQAELSKQTIKGSSDAAMAALGDRIVVSPADVLAAREELFGEVEAFEEAAFLTALWRDQFDEAQALLLADPKLARRAERTKAPADPLELRDSLRVEMAWLARLATPMTGKDRKTLTTNRETLAELDPEEAAGIRATNDLRVLLGLAAVRFEERLGNAARIHSRDMVEHGFFAHDSPVAGRETPWKRAAEAGTSASAENIAAGQSSGPGAVEAWWYSPGHHKNMLSAGHRRIGLGRHERHWTQLFGG